MLIQKLRLQRGWSQEQLAELSGLSTRTIQRIERGQPASVETLKALGAVFEVDFSTLKEPEMSVPASPNTPALVDPATGPLPEQEEALAFAHVRAVKGFYVHAAGYSLGVIGLAVFNILTTPGHLWVFWPTLGWGIGLTIHGLRVFDQIPLLTGAWERREVEKRLGRKL